jgi:hypothetical protein
MTRAAIAASQSDPALNRQFRRWLPDAAVGQEPAPLRSWHAPDVAEPPVSRARRVAEREWGRVTRGTAR